MRLRFWQNPINLEIKRTLNEMEEMHESGVFEEEEYMALANRVDTLERLKRNRRPHVSRDAIFAGIVNILGIALILRHEEFNVIATKAWSLIRKV